MEKCILLRIVIDYDELSKLPLGYGVGPLVANMLRDLATWLTTQLIYEGEWKVTKIEATNSKDIIELVYCGLGEVFPSYAVDHATHIINKHLETYEDIADILTEDAKKQFNELLEKLEWNNHEKNNQTQTTKTCLEYKNKKLICIEARKVLVAGQVL